MAWSKPGTKLLFICFFCFLLIALFPLESYAGNDPTVSESYNQQAPSKQQQQNTAETGDAGLPAGDAPSLWGSLLQVVFALGVVVLLIFLIFKFLSKRSLHGLRQQGPLKAIGGIQLGNGKSLQVIQVGDSLYILGVGENVQLLRHIPAGDEMDVLLSEAEIKPTAEFSIEGWLAFLRRDKQQETLFDGQQTVGTFEQMLEHQWDEVNQNNSFHSKTDDSDERSRGRQP